MVQRNTGQVVGRAIGGKMVVYDGSQQAGTTPMTTDMGNPAITAGQKPAERARTMGLQSNGKGGYMDDSGQVVARTVNGELVFYDDKGGAVTDGAGGQALTQSSPSWVDPDTGLILVPPAQPETPEEKASTPDPIPATPPMGFDLFITQKHKQGKAQAQADREIESRKAALAQKYASDPILNAMFQKMQQKMDAAAQSGDAKREDLAARINDILEADADKYLSAFSLFDDETKVEMATKIPFILAQQAKFEWFQDNVLSKIEEDENLSDDNEKSEQKLAAMSGEDGIKNFKTLSKLQGEFNTKLNDILKLNQETEENTESIDGEATRYNITSVNDPTLDPGEERKENSAKKKQLMAAAKRAAKRLDTEITGAIKKIDWETLEEPTDDADGRRLTAIDALKTWRQQVLPSLDPGDIVFNDPQSGGRGNDQRERIYKLAGFGQNQTKYNGQYGLVVTGEDGNNRVIPLFDAVRKRKLQENIMDHLGVLNTRQKLDAYEVLFG